MATEYGMRSFFNSDGDDPALSIVIPFRGDPEVLRECLESISGQVQAPFFEIIVVDDGNENPVPPEIGHAYGFPLRVYRQAALGVSAARNFGAFRSVGRIILFVDSDVTLERCFLEKLMVSVGGFPEDVAFQGNLRGCTHSFAGRMENLRLRSTIESLRQNCGHVNYLNTSAFAIRSHALGGNSDFFDLHEIRGEDTRLLANLFLLGHRPRLVDEAKASHCPRLGITAYILKHFSIGYYTKPARNTLRDVSPVSLLDRSGRHGVAKRMLKMASDTPVYLAALPLVALAYGFERLGRASHNLFGFRRGRHHVLGLLVDGVRQDELVAIITSFAMRGDGCSVTYLNAWSLVQANRDSAMPRALGNFDICYPDGMGVVFSCFLLGCGRIHKVTANEFIWKLFRQAAILDLSVVLVGAKTDVIAQAAELIQAGVPTLNLVGFFDGYMGNEDNANLRNKLTHLNPGMVIVGMGQPLQEQWVISCRESLPQCAFLCVGGLFDYICGYKPTPPKWIRKAGFEWLFILILRPRFFWKRYLFGLPFLVLLLLKAWFSKICFFCFPESVDRNK